MKVPSLASLLLPVLAACGDSSQETVERSEATRTPNPTAEAPQAPTPNAELGATTPKEVVAPAPLTDLHEGKLVTFRQSDGFFTFQMPANWKAEEQPGAIAINPGLEEGDTLDAVIFVMFGELTEVERGQTIESILTAKESELLASFAGLGAQFARAAAEPKRIGVHGLAGAEQTWHGETGGQPVTLWVGAIVQREYYFGVVALVVDASSQRFLPGARRILASVEPKAPVRDRDAEAELAGLEFASSSDFGGGGSIHTVYEFGADGSVARRTMASGSFGLDGSVGGETIARGTYMVVGSLVYLQFGDGQEVARLARDGSRIGALTLGKRRLSRL